MGYGDPLIEEQPLWSKAKPAGVALAPHEHLSCRGARMSLLSPASMDLLMRQMQVRRRAALLVRQRAAARCWTRRNQHRSLLFLLFFVFFRRRGGRGL